jgi:hypothetical protein
MAQENVSPKSQKGFADQDMFVIASLLRTFTANWRIRAVVKKSYVEQKDFRTFVRIRGKFSEEEKSTLEIDSVAAFESFWKTTLDAKGDFEASHEHGFGLVVQKTQNFAASAWDILRELQPILEVVKTFGGPYGTLAVGTISFLFAVRLPKPVLSYAKIELN